MNSITLENLKSIYVPNDVLARDCAQSTDDLLNAKITARLGNQWTLDDLRGRLQSVRGRDEPQETILLDGKPILELWPIALETVTADGKITITATRPYRTFGPSAITTPNPTKI